MVIVDNATKRDEVLKVLKDELNDTNEILLSLECGELQPENLPIAPKFYMAKKERIEALIWAYKIEERKIAEKNKAENASDRNSGE